MIPFDRSKDQILQHGISVRYYHGNSPEDKIVLVPWVLWSARFQIKIIIPRFFIYDGASVPKSLRSIVSKAGPLEIASLPHDFGYTLPAYHLDETVLTRKDWDLILKDFCELEGMSWRRRQYTYYAVRLGGYFAYNNKDKTFFCPDEHKDWYVQEYSYLNIPKENGDYLIL
jgi:hypothetical protein